MRVATLNLWGRRGDWPSRRKALATGFKQLNPDLLAVQEAIQTDETDQLADAVGDGYYLAHHSDREPEGDVERGQGISIASRWPIEAVHEVDLNVTGRTHDFACSTLVAEITTPLGPVLFVNHLPNWQLDFERERELQAVAAATKIEELRQEHHVILAGDFDADPDAASIRFWTGRQSLEGTSVCYHDAWESANQHKPGDTFTPENPLVADPDWPFRRIDYILIRCGEHGGPTLQIDTCRRTFDQPIDGVWVSDHFGLAVDLTPKD